MTTVNTVLGPRDSSEMGFTLSHEHISLSSRESRTPFQDELLHHREAEAVPKPLREILLDPQM